MSEVEETTVAILGGGPAGATTAAYLSLAGIDHVLFERSRFPRHHVGESLVGAANRVFHEIGFLEKLDAAGFPRKQGAVWIPKSGTSAQSIRVVPDGRFGGLDYTFQVDRARFDAMLLDHAISLGSRVEQEALATGVEQEGGRVTGVRIQQHGRTRTVKARYVVDATGRSTFLGSKFHLKEMDPLFDQYAIYGYWKGMHRGAETTSNDIHIHFLDCERGWAWQIPLEEKITSVGVVTEKEVFRRGGRDVEAHYARQIATNPELARRLAGASRISALRTEGNYSYSMRELAGPGYLLVGDAARFVDPIFSSGVSVAIYSAKFATERIAAVLAGERSEKEAFDDYAAQLRSGIRIWYDFIKIYYKLQGLFTYYLRKPEHQDQLVQLLQGNVYQADDLTILDQMRSDIRRIEASPGHVMQSSLGDIPL
jgi:FADH2 O2-dependent halogenase